MKRKTIKTQPKFTRRVMTGVWYNDDMKRKTIKTQPKFTRRVMTQGDLLASYVFEDDTALQQWKETELPKLEQKYGKLELDISELPGLVVGDKCLVNGEGSEVFTIMELFEYSPNRYGFALDSGWCEEVAKCRTVPTEYKKEFTMLTPSERQIIEEVIYACREHERRVVDAVDCKLRWRRQVAKDIAEGSAISATKLEHLLKAPTE